MAYDNNDISGYHGYNDDGRYSEEDASSTTDNDNNSDNDGLPSVDKLTV